MKQHGRGKLEVSKMRKFKDFINRLGNIPYVNRYSVTLFFFVVWILFFDSNSFVNRFIAYRRQCKVNEQIEKYQKELDDNKALLDVLEADVDELERYAREEYGMKRKNEDVYIIREE